MGAALTRVGRHVGLPLGLVGWWRMLFDNWLAAIPEAGFDRFDKLSDLSPRLEAVRS